MSARSGKRGPTRIQLKSVPSRKRGAASPRRRKYGPGATNLPLRARSTGPNRVSQIGKTPTPGFSSGAGPGNVYKDRG